MSTIDALKERIEREGRTDRGAECEAVRAIRDRRAIMLALVELLERPSLSNHQKAVIEGVVKKLDDKALMEVMVKRFDGKYSAQAPPLKAT